jgi:fructokinase
MSDTLCFRMQKRIYGAVEAGGTKFVCAIGDATGTVLEQSSFPTSDPSATLARMQDFLQAGRRRCGDFTAIGLGSFGPVILDRQSAHYGFIGSTPKQGWSHTDIAGVLAREFGCPIGFDTDVNAAALAEHRWGAAQDIKNLVYVTVGTGIGGGVLIDGAPLHGLLHPEIGHIYPRRHHLDAGFQGVCPFHGDCLEGLASGPAILRRSGAQLQDLETSHLQWELEADYLGQLCAQLVLTLSPQRIVMGGGVLTQERLLPFIRQRLQHWLRGYVDHPDIGAHVDGFVVAPALGTRAGVLGALVLAMNAS